MSRDAAAAVERAGTHSRCIEWLWDGSVSCVDRSDQYRRFAQECLAMARTSESDHTRVVLIQMAQLWFRLAEACASDEPARRPGMDTEE